jgi:hypothetical protein
LREDRLHSARSQTATRLLGPRGLLPRWDIVRREQRIETFIQLMNVPNRPRFDT